MPRLLAATLVALLAACSTTDTLPPAPADWEQHRARLAQLHSWSASGKISLRSPDAAESASLKWQQREGRTRIRLSGPLGTGATEIRSHGDYLEVRRGDELRRVDMSSRATILRDTGWDLPLRALPYWLRGLPDPQLPLQALAFDPDSGLPRALSQDGWQVRFEAYGEFDALPLPTRLVVENGATRVTLLLRRWQTGQD
ncbi:MAG: outer membrane lipoprotein LolB [Halioglobus sp.]|nr:outer membrane lipoprotein LolB [Halioglobus sp.]